MATATKSSAVKVKPSSQDGSSKAKIDSSANKKKIDNPTKQPADSNVKSVTKSEVKSKTASSSSKTRSTRVRQKKVYSLPGQKHDIPEEKEPLRIFYKSLSKQIPTSEMAEFWLMEHGMLSPERARKAFEKKQRKQNELRTGTPVKPSKPPTKPETSQKQRQASNNGDLEAKKRIINDNDDDDDFILSPKRRKG